MYTGGNASSKTAPGELSAGPALGQNDRCSGSGWQAQECSSGGSHIPPPHSQAVLTGAGQGTAWRRCLLQIPPCPCLAGLLLKGTPTHTPFPSNYWPPGNLMSPLIYSNFRPTLSGMDRGWGWGGAETCSVASAEVTLQLSGSSLVHAWESWTPGTGIEQR